MRKLRVLTIGAGYFSAFHHDAWQRIREVELVGVCDRDPARAQANAERFAVPSWHTDAAAMLDMNIKAFESLLLRARRALRDMLVEHEDG